MVAVDSPHVRVLEDGSALRAAQLNPIEAPSQFARNGVYRKGHEVQNSQLSPTPETPNPKPRSSKHPDADEQASLPWPWLIGSFGVQELGFRVAGFWSRVSGLGFRVEGLAFRVLWRVEVSKGLRV